MVVPPPDTRITVDRNHHRGVDTLTAKILYDEEENQIG